VKTSLIAEMKKKKKKDIRDMFIEMVPNGTATVLDVGCGDGSLGQKLKRNSMHVTGIDIMTQLVDAASKVIDEAYVCNIEKDPMPFPQKKFDCIICADIIEHVHDPVFLLNTLKKYLADDGVFVVSMPNVRYYKVWKQVLLLGCWDYAPTGILDDSHVRFYARRNMLELFESCELTVSVMKKMFVQVNCFLFSIGYLLNCVKIFLCISIFLF
jgi:SAM-dependent methyltransferase